MTVDGVGEESLAHEMIGHAGLHAELPEMAQVAHEAGKVRPGGKQVGHLEESEPPAWSLSAGGVQNSSVTVVFYLKTISSPLFANPIIPLRQPVRDLRQVRAQFVRQILQ